MNKNKQGIKILNRIIKEGNCDWSNKKICHQCPLANQSKGLDKAGTRSCADFVGINYSDAKGVIDEKYVKAAKYLLILLLIEEMLSE